MLATVDWAAIGGIAAVVVALFTGLTALITYLQHRHELAVTGWRNPIRIRRPSRLSGVKLAIPRTLETAPVPEEESEAHRELALQIFNRSAVPQVVMFDKRKTRVRFPRRVRAQLVTTGFEVSPHSGGIVFLVMKGEWSKAHHSPNGMVLCFVTIRAGTNTGHKIRRRLVLSVGRPFGQRP